jgi:hypothetical protein
MAEEKEIDVYKTSKATLYRFAFFAAIVVVMILIIRSASKNGATTATS